MRCVGSFAKIRPILDVQPQRALEKAIMNEQGGEWAFVTSCTTNKEIHRCVEVDNHAVHAFACFFFGKHSCRLGATIFSSQ